MKINIMCDWCGKRIKTVNGFEAVRDAQQMGQDKCEVCMGKVAKIDGWLNGAKDKYVKKLDITIKQLKDEFVKEVKKGSVNERTDLQNMGAESKNTRRRPE